MADTFTPNYDFVLPEIGGSLDTWGNKLNENFSRIDDLLVHPGIIVMWSGAVNAIPAGWALCNGSNGTPNLRDRFVVGAGSTYPVGDTGGAANVTLTTAQIPAHNHTTQSAGSHNHGGTQNAGSHSHSGSTNTAGQHTHTETSRGSSTNDGSQPNHWIGPNNVTRSTAPAGSHSHSLSINPNGTHSHSISQDGDHTHTVNNTGGGNSHENRPPYYALAYIMKL